MTDKWLERYIALSEMKDWQESLDWCQKWTKSEPQNAFAWCGLGVAYEELNRHKHAIEAYRQALLIDPENAVAWFSLGNVYGKRKCYNDAIEAYYQALRFKPEITQALYSLGAAYAFSGNKIAALNAIHIFKDDPLSEDGKRALAIILGFSEHSDEVDVAFYDECTPWISRKYKHGSSPIADLLVGAFVVGNIRPQLEHSVKKDCPYEGVLQVISTYELLKSRNSTENIPSIEKWIKLRNSGKLKEYIVKIQNKYSPG